MRALPSFLILAASGCWSAETAHPSSPKPAVPHIVSDSAAKHPVSSHPEPSAGHAGASAPQDSARHPAKAESAPARKTDGAGHASAKPVPPPQKAEAHAGEAHPAGTHPHPSPSEKGNKPSKPEETHGHRPEEATGHAGHAAAGKEDAPESHAAPSLRPHPDTVFARAADWEKGDAEILAYDVKRTLPAGEILGRGRLVTERMFLRADGTVARARNDRDEIDILNASLNLSGEMGAQPFSSETVVQLPRRGDLALLRQEQSLQGWPGISHRSLDCRAQPPRLRIASSGGEPARDTLLARWPVYTEEMLFTYLRAVPLREGYREEAWLQDWGPEGRFAIRPRYALITVREKAAGVRDMDTWRVTVERDDGRRSEFWVAASGLHPIVVARLADGSEWALKGISRQKYWSW